MYNERSHINAKEYFKVEKMSSFVIDGKASMTHHW